MYTVVPKEKKHDEAFVAFEKAAWPPADQEHYGEHLPDFSRHQFILVAEEGGEVVGSIKVSTDAGVGLIDSLLVRPDRQKQGIGRALVQAAEEKARALAVHKMTLETGADWGARHLYTKRGYAVRAQLPNHFGKREFILMDKELS